MLQKKFAVAVSCTAFAVLPGLMYAAVGAKDTGFMRIAAENSMREAHLGQMATAQASQQDVSAFGRKLDTDYTAAYQGLTAIANKEDAALPKGINVRQDGAIEGLTHLKGSSFDRTFLRDEVQDQKRMLAEFQNEADHGKNAEVKAWAGSMIPAVEARLDTAENLAKEETSSSRK